MPGPVSLAPRTQAKTASTADVERKVHVPTRLSKAGDKGLHVAWLQDSLRRLGFSERPVNGTFGTATQRALKAFQQAQNVPVTGSYDTATRAALRAALGESAWKNGAGLAEGTRNHVVRALERKLKQRGLLEGKADGAFDAKTRAAVQKLERALGWKADGVVGGPLWREIFEAAPGTRGDKKAYTFGTVNINVKNNPLMPQAKVIHDVKRAAKSGGLIGWNEIGPDRYFKAIRDLGPEWGHFMPRHGKMRIPNPISFKKDIWQLQDGGFLKTHDGLAKVSPSRYITWAKLKHRDSGRTVVRLNTHLVSGAWSEKKPTTAWRRAQWNVHIRKLTDLVERFKDQGHVVIVGGDFNRDSYRVLGNKVEYDNKLTVGTHGKRTLDYVMHVRNAAVQKLRAAVRGGYASDHDAVVVRYSLKAKGP